MTDDPNFIGVLYGDAFTGQNQVTRVGHPAYSFFVNKQVYDQNGRPLEGLYVDLSGEGGVVAGDNADKYIFKNPAPDYLLGFSTNFNYKRFDISAAARASIGNYVYNMLAAENTYSTMQQIGYWRNSPKQLNDTHFIARQFSSDYYVENGSFFRLDNVRAGYRFENVMDRLNTYVSFTVQNAFTMTNYKGLDPEVSGGIDRSFYPRPRIFTLGLSITY
jgi:TonB-dependent starch-binding outer membrane protein SusC